MEQFAHISVQQAQQKQSEGTVRFVDIRDDSAFEAGHIKDSTHLTNGSLHSFMADVEFDTPVIVCCYHGISSQQAAQFLIHQGFEEVYSLDGGFEAWRKDQPFEISHPAI
ncbi:thiosulfate sulfurtransferase GlpE [Paraglaciecola psychrophila]|jgi:thiosulfate sulfurtransferase|uniref:Thiosulfate sulfurtransferase GlpE n=1 Tax=Paraglaciecola psychrophila 170 TaxID=1129794 RepID=K7ABG4_9ALTE|nr:thiosulfate sulfurtransferase GlpE [Paraglaciecola psychrophila]AGH42209.1 thiosulfate sulfurtransferase [Paraglaciecola psychrophila 170]GAC39637.1 thiosulfate sulfurtransferase [Paraglaciecola psychrophila 170]